MSYIKLSIRSKEKEVLDFLQQLQEVIRNERFDTDTDITIINKEKE